MIFLPHTNTVILLEPYCGTITEPGLPVAPLAPVNTNVPVPHTLAGPSMTATKENLFTPSLSGFQAQNFSVNPTMMRSQEQTMMNTFNNCQVSFIIGRSKRASEISKRQPSSCKRRAFIIEDDSDWTFTFPDYCKASFLYINVKRLKGVKSTLRHFQGLIWMILKVSVL